MNTFEELVKVGTAEANTAAEEAQELLLLLNRIGEIKGISADKKPKVAKPVTVSSTGGKRGRPRKDATAETASVAPVAPVLDADGNPVVKRRGRPRKDTTVTETGEKRHSLASLLQEIGKNSDVPMSTADFVTAVNKAGHKSNSKNFANVVYQTLRNLSNAGVFTKDENRSYKYVGTSAA